MTWTLAGLLVSALVAEAIGIHAIFGAFLFGAIVPADSPIARQLRDHRTPVVTILFLPAFFALTGLRTEIGLVSSWQDWGICLLIIALATAGKFGGTFVAARLMGMPEALRRAARHSDEHARPDGAGGAERRPRPRRDQPALFTMMVIMALVTTAMTAPLLDLVAEQSAASSSRTPNVAPTPAPTAIAMVLPVDVPPLSSVTRVIVPNGTSTGGFGHARVALDGHARRRSHSSACPAACLPVGPLDADLAAGRDPLDVVGEDGAV